MIRRQIFDSPIPLERCPFCGRFDGDLYISSLWSDDVGLVGYAVHCSECMADGPEADTIQEAAERWNARVAG